MKRLFSICLLLSLLLSACGGKTPEETTGPAPETTPETTVATQATAAPTEETEPQEAKLRHPLNGKVLEEPFLGRPVTATINNLRDAMPQHGISYADILYEVETEGGITRCLPVFTDLTHVAKLGPVRSARTYFNNITLSYGAIITHCGASKYARIPSYDSTGTVIPNWEHIDGMTHSGFYRDKDRLNSGYALEHTMFISGPGILKNIEKDRLNFSYDRMQDYGLQFADSVELEGEQARKLEIRFRGDKKTFMTYQEDKGVYEAAQYDKPWIDANTDKTLAFQNVLVLKTRQFSPNGKHSMYDLQGSGEGVLAMGGRIVPITWERSSDVNTPFRYTLQDGTPVTLRAGKTYVALMDVKGSVKNS